MGLSVQNLSVRIGANSLLEGIGFNADAGSMHAVVGPNGAGKTTLLRSLAALQPYRGRAQFEGVELQQTQAQERSRWMAYLPQFFSGVNLSVLEVLELARRPFGPPCTQRERIDRQIETFELQPVLAAPLDRLSGGQRQMVMIAAALLQTPRLLLLDEPTAHLDPKNRLEVLRRLREATREQNIATLIVLHDLQHALHYCDRLLLLKAGRLCAHEAAAELSSEQLGDLYGVESRLFWHEGHPYVAFAHRHEGQGLSHRHQE